MTKHRKTEILHYDTYADSPLLSFFLKLLGLHQNASYCVLGLCRLWECVVHFFFFCLCVCFTQAMLLKCMLMCMNLSSRVHFGKLCILQAASTHVWCVLPFMQLQQLIMKMDVCTVMWSTCAARGYVFSSLGTLVNSSELRMACKLKCKDLGMLYC